MTRVSIHPADPPGSSGASGQSGTYGSIDGFGFGPTGPIERIMSAVIRKLAWSRLSEPRVAVGLSGAGLLLSMVVGATAPNAETPISVTS